MKLKHLFILFFVTLFFSCQNDNKQLIIEQKREAEKQEGIFKSINRGWIFEITPLEPKTQAKVNGWAEWRNFLTEINQKPKTSIGAFQKKASVLSKKVVELNNNIPIEFDKPQIKSRIAVLTTKIKELDLYIHLSQIPTKKVVKIIGEINSEIDFFEMQMEEIVYRSQIPLEPGEEEIIKMKDSSRAVPDDMNELDKL